jgi:hypothetical protein
MTNEQIIEAIREGGYPDNLLDSEIVGAVKYVLRDLKFEYPVMLGGFFDLVPCQQVYDLFNTVPDAATSQGVFPGGLRAYELVWTNNLSGDNLSVFGLAPILQGGAPILGLPSTWSFYTPGDWVLWDQDWAALIHRFSPGEFEHLDNRPGSPIRVFPVPQGACRAFVRFTKPRTEAELRDEDESWFLKLVEARCCRVLARTFSLCAGITFAEALRDDGKLLRHWEQEAKDLEEQGWELFNARRHEGVWPAQRSHGP